MMPPTSDLNAAMTSAHRTPTVMTGLDRLFSPELASELESLRHKRVGLLVNPTSMTSNYTHAIDAFMAAGVNVIRLFGPEHGVRAEAQDMESVVQSIDAVSGLPVISLYGDSEESLFPDKEWLEDLDVVIADIQDIGTRYYTYAYTVGLMMKACQGADTSCWILDRPNPLGGQVVEGNVVSPQFASFVGMQPLATRHGMTLGELAGFFSKFCGWDCDHRVIEMKGWTRQMWYDETGLPWVMPSPNMPTLETAVVYPGQCLLEGTNLSEGRGTTRPFELFGAPYLDALELKRRLDAHDLPGVAFRAVSFKPMFQKHAGEICHGVQIHVTDRDVFRSLEMSVAILVACRDIAPEQFGWREQAYEFVDDQLAIDLLFGHDRVRLGLESGKTAGELIEMMEQDRADFDTRRAQVLLYD